MGTPEVLVVGQLVRDLVVVVDELPPVGAAADVRLRREMLGGKGANQAVGLAQLGVSVGLVAVAGDDPVADDLLAQAARDGIDVTHVVRRPRTSTGLIIDVLDRHGRWRYLQHLPEPVLLTESDVVAAADTLAAAAAVVIQLQQPSAAALCAARQATGLVVLDGTPADDDRRPALLARADVIRADAREAATLLGTTGDDDPAPDLPTAGVVPGRILDAARRLLDSGPRLVALAVDPVGNLFVWSDGHLLVPLTDTPVVDTTGAGDAFTAALTMALLRNEPPERAARLAVAAASATVGHPGGRPDLNPDSLRSHLARVDASLGRVRP
ncbi:PfkB family carbohydrate kinase [Micromonospora sonneratiae]|uniref:PfkB family carbohydrate kinase n=1 Tax=Micromonospora sonneratiae TaxID=1184706 RepID=A0ABW3YP68_9ACTN